MRLMVDSGLDMTFDHCALFGLSFDETARIKAMLCQHTKSTQVANHLCLGPKYDQKEEPAQSW